MAETKTYKGGCHCGKVSYDATVDLSQVIECNCSHCRRKGFLLTFVPAGQFTLESGEGALTDYLFHKHAISHRFCATCGAQPFAEGEQEGAATRAVNLRCVPDCDLGALEIRNVDGASF